MENSKIYKITSPQIDKIYIGSTTKNLNERLRGHKKSLKNYNKGIYSYITSFEIIIFNDCKIELIEEFPCNSKKELRIRERHHIEQNENVINQRIPYLSLEEKKNNTKKFQNTKIICNICKKEITKNYLNRHQKTKKCY